MNKREQILSLYDDIYNLNVCGKDPQKVRRDISKTNLNSKIMIIAEAMAPEQVRLSGINYFFKDGTIGSTGKSLEKFLNLFNHSVYPDNPNCIYHTEIVHSFPGYIITNGKRTIRRPNKKEIEESINSHILEREIDIIEPKIILLMGNTAYQTFYKYILNIKLERNLTREKEYISENRDYHLYENIPVIPIQHSSGANPRFNQMLKNKKLIGIIKNILEE